MDCSDYVHTILFRKHRLTGDCSLPAIVPPTTSCIIREAAIYRRLAVFCTPLFIIIVYQTIVYNRLPLHLNIPYTFWLLLAAPKRASQVSFKTAESIGKCSFERKHTIVNFKKREKKKR